MISEQRSFADALASMGQVGTDLLDVDWAATPLGMPDSWPQSLRTAAAMVLSSRFSMWMAWGPDLTFLCNDAYRRDTLGKKYPWALGKPAREVWAEIWPDIGPRIEHVTKTGEATWDEALLLFLERSGYTEETYHTFSYSPLTGDDGRIAGMLCVVTEDTERVIANRRMGTLRDLGSDLTSLHSEAELLVTAGRRLAGNPESIPFALLYLFEEESDTAHLATTAGVAVGHRAAPPLIRGDDENPTWPASEVAAGNSVLVETSARRFGELPTGAWTEPPEYAYVVPLRQQGQARPWGFLVAALNRHRPFDAGYRTFIDLVAGQLAAGLASARAYETERIRAEQLAELDRAKTQFFTNISHELRTPLTLLLGPAEDALADAAEPLPEGQRTRIEMIERNGRRLLHLVNNLLDFSRIEAGRVRAQYEEVDLVQHTAELASMFRAAVERAGLRLDLDLEAVGERVYVDRDMWARIVLNLLSNAVKYTFEGTIAVGLKRVGDVVELAVSDTGIGIAAEHQSRLFERFQRVDGARARTHEGSGIGLALVAELASLHGGEVALESTLGAGSTFTVRLPVGHQHLPADQLKQSPAPTNAPVAEEVEGFIAEVMRWLETGVTPTGVDAGRAGSDDAASGDEGGAGGSGTGTGTGTGADSDGSGGTGAGAGAGARRRSRGDVARRVPRILVADDNADMRDYIVRLLEGSYAVSAAPDGVVALEMARANPPDLVISDIMMPRLNGFELLRELRSDPATLSVPVVMLSARAGDEGVIEGLEAGADDYLIKPFSARELVARVRSSIELDRARRTRDALERNRLLLDQAQRLAHVGSWELDFSSGELTASDELLRILGVTRAELEQMGYAGVIERFAHPDDRHLVSEATRGVTLDGRSLDFEVRMRAARPDSQAGDVQRWVHVLGEVVTDGAGNAVALRGSIQDTTEQHDAETRLTAAAAEREATAREHRIADELQRSLLPPRTFDPEHLEVATFYRAGVEGTQVGGDWYDVIELGAGRTALVIGDVMGRGVRAAAVMGQLRSAIRAYARLDLAPADVLELADVLVRDLEGSQIVTCIYATYDPTDRSVTFARAGHLPPTLVVPGEEPVPLLHDGGPPLGAGPFALVNERVELAPGAAIALYTDGLIERRNRDLTDGMAALGRELASRTGGPIEDLPERLVAALLEEEPDDDIAVLIARVPADSPAPAIASLDVPTEHSAVRIVRRQVEETLGEWDIASALRDDIVLVVSELVTNAIVHGGPPVTVRMCRMSAQLVVEICDTGALLPRRQRITDDDEHGRGLQVISALSEQWGARPVPDGKCVWCSFRLADRPRL